MAKRLPPTSVQAKPVATPISLGVIFSRWYFGIPKYFSRLLAVVSIFSFPGLRTNSLVTFRQRLAISRSKFLTPASWVYSEIIRLSAGKVITKDLSVNPCSFNCFGIRYRLAISIFSSVVYPGKRRVSKRSCNEGGIEYKVFAVVMNITSDKLNSTSR